MAELNITIKTSGDKRYEIEISADATVADLKARVAQQSDIPAEQQRLIFSGRILKDPEPLSQYNIKSGCSVHLVKGAARKPQTAATPSNPAAAAPTNLAAGQHVGNPLSDLTGARYSGLANLPSASLFGPDGGQGAMPSMSELNEMISQNPEALEQAIDMIMDGNSPLLAEVPAEQRQQMMAIFRSPATRSLLMDPEFMRRVVEAESEMRALGLMDGLSQTGRNPFSMDPALAAQILNGNPGGAAAAASAASLGAAGAAGAGGAAGGAGRAGASPFMPPVFDTRPPEERYETQLRQLNELGFVDFDRNVRALRRSGGNVEGAVEALLENHV